MLYKSLLTSFSSQWRSSSRALHVSAARLSYPVGKTGKLLTPYIRFTTEKRGEILARNPEYSITEVGRRLGELWRELPESERQRYRDEYARAKESSK